MYPDPKKVKDNRMMIRLNDYQYKLLHLIANTTGEQPSSIARDLLMDAAVQKFPHLHSMQPASV